MRDIRERVIDLPVGDPVENLEKRITNLRKKVVRKMSLLGLERLHELLLDELDRDLSPREELKALLVFEAEVNMIYRSHRRQGGLTYNQIRARLKQRRAAHA